MGVVAYLEILVLTAVASGCVLGARQRPASESCSSILHRIEGAKASWALENQKGDEAVPTEDDLCGPGRYLSKMPRCPQGGKISLGRLTEPPSCSIPGHSF